MHTAILGLHHILTTPTKSTLRNLTETKPINIKSIWRETLQKYKLIHTSSRLDHNTNRRSAGTVLAIRRDAYKNDTTIPTPIHLRDYITVATLIPHDGSSNSAISAYMLQINTKEQEAVYNEQL